MGSTETEKLQRELERYIDEKITLQRYFNEYIVPLKPGIRAITDTRGSTICPFHDETKPSFHYFGETDSCYCFGNCGAGGDLIAIYRLKSKIYDHKILTRMQAVNALIELYSLQQDAKVIWYKNQIVAGSNGIEKQSVFEEARNKLLNTQTLAVASDQLTLTKYRQAQERILQQKMNLKSVCMQLNDIDIHAGIAVKQKQQ